MTNGDLELWAAFAAKPHGQPAGACSLADLVAEARRLRAELDAVYRDLPGWKKEEIIERAGKSWPCAVCGKTITWAADSGDGRQPRSDRETCSDYCRVKRWRQKKREPADAEPTS